MLNYNFDFKVFLSLSLPLLCIKYKKIIALRKPKKIELVIYREWKYMVKKNY